MLKSDEESDVSPELEALLLEGLASPAKEVTPADWDARREKLRNQFANAR